MRGRLAARVLGRLLVAVAAREQVECASEARGSMEKSKCGGTSRQCFCRSVELKHALRVLRLTLADLINILARNARARGMDPERESASGCATSSERHAAADERGAATSRSLRATAISARAEE